MTGGRGRSLVAALALALAGTGCAGDLPAASVTCTDLGGLALIAQAVPEARSVPCFPTLPYGYRTTTFDVGSGEAAIGLSHAVLGPDVAVMRIAADCPVQEGPDVPAPEPGHRLDQLRPGTAGGAVGRWIEGLGGACLVVELQMDHPDGDRALADLDGSWQLLPRADLAAALSDGSDGLLRLDDHARTR